MIVGPRGPGLRLPSAYALGLATAALAWAAVLFAAYHPGLMSADSVSQYAMGLTGDYSSNVHPPILSWLLGLSARSVGSPWPLLAVQLAALAGGMAVLAASARRVAGAALLGAFLVSPATWAIAVALWKDVWMAACLLWAVVALRSGRRGIAAALIVLAACFRHNALVAALPLVVAVVATSTTSRARRAMEALALAAAIVLAPAGVERLLRVRDAWPGGQLLVYDLAAIYVQHPEDFPRSTFARDVAVEDLARHFTPFGVVPLLFTDVPPGRRIPWSSVAPRRGDVTREWVREVVSHPRSYARHRLEQYRLLLGSYVCYAFHRQMDPNPWGLHLEETPLLAALRSTADGARQTPLFLGWPWLAISALIAGIALRARDALATATAASGFAYGAAYLVIGVSCEFRFFYWTIVACFAAALLRLAPPSTKIGAPSSQ